MDSVREGEGGKIWENGIETCKISHELQHASPPCPSPTPGVHSNSCPSSQWCHTAISCSVVPFSSCPQSLPASESFPMSQLVAWGGQSIGVSALASVLPMNTQDWSPLEWTGWISLQSKGLVPQCFTIYYIDLCFYANNLQSRLDSLRQQQGERSTEQVANLL